MFHHPPERDAERLAARARELSRVRRFLDRIRANGRPGVLVRNALGIAPLLSEIGRRTLGGIAPRPFFGVGPSAALAPRIGQVSPSIPASTAGTSRRTTRCRSSARRAPPSW